MAVFRRWIPGKLKHRLIVSFLIVVLVPLCLFQLLYYGQMETNMERNISLQNNNHLKVIKNDFESLKFEMLRGMILFEQNRRAITSLNEPDFGEAAEAKQQMRDILKSSFENVRTYQERMRILLFNGQGKMVSLSPTQENENIGNTSMIAEGCPNPEQWKVSKPGFSGGRSTSTLMAMCSNLVDEKKLYVGTLYFIIDLDLWLRTIVNHLSVKQNYYMLNEDGDALAGTGAFDTMHRERLVPYLHSMQEGHYLDRASSSVITYTYLPSIQLYLVSQFELASIVGDLNEIRNNLITAVVLLAILFIAVTYLISATVTRPLRLLQLRMNQTAKTNLKVNIPENGYRGEILDLCQSFNSMVADMNELVQRLRLEERQKEAIHFKMLVAQMNPHFLFNTLNTIKWNAVDRNDEVTSAICSSLGSLLETSLNSDIDLIHLKDELDLIHAYLYIQQLRYANRFEVHFNIDEELYYALVPKLSLQPLVENAIIHGFSQTMDGGVIVITARQKNRMMILEVTDNGIGIKEPKPSRSSRRSEGIGIGNLKERLRLLFRDEARLDMVPLDQGTSVSFSFPLLQSQPYDQEKEECHVDRYSR